MFVRFVETTVCIDAVALGLMCIHISLTGHALGGVEYFLLVHGIADILVGFWGMKRYRAEWREEQARQRQL